MADLIRTPLLFEAGAFRHLGRIERDASPEEREKLKARTKWLKKRQNVRFSRGLAGSIQNAAPDPKNLKQYGVKPDAPAKHPSSEKKHYPRDYTSG